MHIGRTMVKCVMNFERHACMKALLLVGNSLPSNSTFFMMRSTLLIGIIWPQVADMLN
jgi:hypothetical protein